MRDGELAKLTKNFTIWIVVLSIIGLFLMSFLPLISVTENDSVKQDLYFNFDMMKKSDNEQIITLAGEIYLITISFWALIILGLLSYLGATIQASGIKSLVGRLLLIIGCGTLIFSILVVDFQLIILENIWAIDTISPAAVYPPIYYTYMSLIPGFLILIFSVLYTLPVVAYSIHNLKSLKKTKKGKNKEKKKPKKTIKKKDTIEAKKLIKKEKPVLEKVLKEPGTHENRIELGEMLTGQGVNIAEQTDKDNPQEPKKEIKIEPEETKPPKPPFPDEKTSDVEEKIKESDKLPLSEPFKGALSSTNVNMQTKTNEEPEKKKYKVRCPKCKNIFPIENEGAITKIKCPKCDKEGFVRLLQN